MSISFETVGIVCGAIVSAGAALAGTYRYVIVPVRSFFKAGIETYETVQKELRANGGNSLRDMVARIDNRLLVNEVRARAMIEHIRMCAFEADRHGVWTFVSRELCRLLDCTPDQLLGHGWKAYVHPSCRDCVSEEWDDCVRQHRDFSVNFPLSSNMNVCLHSEAFVLKDPSGVAIGFIGSITPGSPASCPRDCLHCERQDARPRAASRIGPSVSREAPPLGDPEE